MTRRTLFDLLEALREAGADSAARTLANRAAAQASLGYPGVVFLQNGLLNAGAKDAIRTLARRIRAHVVIKDPGDLWVIWALSLPGADLVIRSIADQAVAQIHLDDTCGIDHLLRALHAVGDDDAARALLARDPATHVSLHSWFFVSQLLKTLRAAGADDQAWTLARRAANAGMFWLFLDVYVDEAARYHFGCDSDGAPAQPWIWQKPD